MALRELVEGECGAANPLVKWTSHFSQEKSMLNVGLDHDRLLDISKRPGITEEQLVDEFLGPAHHRPTVPQTFEMTSLLDELQQVSTPFPRLHPQAHENVRVKEWVEEFATTTPPLALHATPSSAIAGTWASEFQNGVREMQSTETEQWVREFAPTEDEKWVEEFQSHMTSNLASVAKEMTKTITDPAINGTEFMDFIKKLSSGEATLDDRHEDTFEMSAGKWEDEFTEGEGAMAKVGNGGFWDQLENDWQDLSRKSEQPWLLEFESDAPVKYTFQEENPLKDVKEPLEEGLRRLAEGDLPSAVLLFEAEVQMHPTSVHGWQLLGSTQADNEQDLMAIPALHKCLELDPGNLTAHMSLSVCYTNEGQQTKALGSLRNWLVQHPKYSALISSAAATQASSHVAVSSFMSKEEHASVRDLYLTAAQMSPDKVDSDVQVGLGVLFNLSNEYDKALDCFTAALQEKPDDALLWNKLGATLANNSKSEKAVSAYRKALELLPGFTRCRYNLGVSCINLGAYKEAVEHFLTALHLQQQAKGLISSPKALKMSESIWSTLNLAVSLAGRQELQAAVRDKDLATLLGGFGIA